MTTRRPEAPAPLSRRGPRPLMLHLSLAWMRSSSSSAASLNWNSVWANSWPDNPPNPAAQQTTLEEILRRDRALIAGIAAYRSAPYMRELRPPPAIWEEEETQLLDYGGTGPSVLFVPSLINRAYILDLMEGGSMLRFLGTQNLHPYLLDWGWPGQVERQFSLTDYIAGRLERALAAIPGPVILAGYCMGGLLALASALRAQQSGTGKVRALALLATPWDFHAADATLPKRISEAMPAIEMMLQFSSTLPIDALNTLFAMVDPYGVGDKYRDFAAQDKTLPRAQRFVAMEDWLADGVPLAAPVARETLGGWYVANNTVRNQWRVAGQVVDPAQLALPAFCAIPARDRLVPAVSAQALAARLPQATILQPKAGHIGMVAGSASETSLWRPFADWVHSL
ncbi:alpha/beta fold hydrolase [Acidocella aromatica]|uniref:Polyhydroxyalkanoate synthase n=1 Tax=Acidocella aromatica TaxID=1303579 RepID=A0A840VU40_9PROT|nr:alpha/beta fold hydrolase [Acidocella aromatica]MBB5373722.1 polyhydroxyalkanoate synthase [Acidocella aromatica]